MSAPLTDTEREALFVAGDHHPDVCDCTAYAEECGYDVSEQMCDGFIQTVAAVEEIVAARVAAAEQRLAAVRAVADGWEAATCITDGAPCSFHRHATGYAGDLRAALAADPTTGGDT